MDSVFALFLAFLHPAATPPATVPLPPLRPAIEAPAPASSVPALSCSFHETAQAGRRVIVARVSGPAAARGTFAFTLHQSDAHRNTISTSQDGDYAVPVGGGSVEVADTRIEAGQGDRVDARLDLQRPNSISATSCSDIIEYRMHKS